MKIFARENTWLKNPYYALDHGWGNGYVCIPKGHPLYGIHYNDIHDLIPSLEVNGGLTFSEYAHDCKDGFLPEGCEDTWIVGFDTAHSWDNMSMWPNEQSVLMETERLKEQIENYKP